ncbi:hypothetical protein XF_0168 [Xylella fastidiosa 9a5c]|uniref:Uncharacterized protein n=1 Tax=Xylella fastidiosa (strain 9a5c) TaxID=160492 RepID=Q9PGX8_XYLFA|nr:hypothetical protein XF_0168 [Xylella fastidiosa 9a5c]
MEDMESFTDTLFVSVPMFGILHYGISLKRYLQIKLKQG